MKEGKPEPEPFQTALKKLNLKPEQAIVVENSPLEIESEKRAGIRFINTLNNTPLELSDFKSLSTYNKEELKDMIFKDTKSAIKFLNEWCKDKKNLDKYKKDEIVSYLSNCSLCYLTINNFSSFN